MSKKFEKLIEIMSTLRSPDGCPWDHEQSHTTLKKYLIEECYEVIDAIDHKNDENLCEELGDLLLQIVFHSQIAKEENRFNIDDVIQGISDKMIRRHPHVFSDKSVKNSSEVLENWDKIKDNEKKDQKEESCLDSIPQSLPALFESYKIGKKASKKGFDWPNTKGVIEKIEEELLELKESLERQKEDEIVEEFGDFLFSLSNLARHLQLDPEDALKKTNKKFRQRFSFIEKKIRIENQKIEEKSLGELEELWLQSKKYFKS